MKKYPDEWGRIQKLLDKDFGGNKRQFCINMGYPPQDFQRDQENQALPLRLLTCMYHGHDISSDYILYDRGEPYYRTSTK